MCPPFAPAVDEFRKMLKDHRCTLLAKFPVQAVAEPEVTENLLRCRHDMTTPVELRENASRFWSEWSKDKKRVQLAFLELEKAAFNKGYVFAVGFSTGSCTLCEKCNVEAGICVHPTMARYSEHAVGIYLKKNTKKLECQSSLFLVGSRLSH